MKNHHLSAALCAFAIILVATGCHKNDSIPSAGPTGPAITYVNPSTVEDSTLVTIKGTGFGTSQGGDNVSFNGKQAVLVSTSDTKIVAMVPTLAGSGNITVTTNGTTISGGIFIYDTTYRVSTLVSSLNAPWGLTLDGNGNLFFATYGSQLINEINTQGVTSNFAAVGSSFAIASDASNNIYVAPIGPNSVSSIDKISPAGIVTPIALDSGLIFGLVVDGSGNVYAANGSTSTINKITPQGVVSVFASGLANVGGLAMGSDGSIYATTTSDLTNQTAGSIVKITPAGVATTMVTGLTFSESAGIAIDANNVLYVTCFNQAEPKNYVVKIESVGSGFSNIALDSGDYIPIGITIDKTGNLYVVYNSTSPANPLGSVVKMTMH
jgi:hypothetical protein